MSRSHDMCGKLLMLPIFIFLAVVFILMIYQAVFPKKEEIKSKPNTTYYSQTGSGLCDYPWQTAKDGSICGKRAKNK